MSGFDEDIVREYFELNHFFVRQLRKYRVRPRRKVTEDSVSMLVWNPAAAKEWSQSNMQLFSADMASVRQAFVVMHGWQHTQVTPAILKSNARLASFLKKEVLNQFSTASFKIEDDSVADLENYRKIAIVPGIPSANPYRSECLDLFQDQGIDGMIAFSTLLEDCMRHVEVNHSYHKSKLLQLVRILKIYDMVQSPQLRLF